MPGPRVAIVHEKFTIDAGSERVVDQFHQLWPDAPIYCAVRDVNVLSDAVRDADIRPHPLLQRLYRGGDHYAHLLPLLPLATSTRHVDDVDVVVTSHHQFANRVRSTAPIVSYVHTPARWMWDPAMRVDEVGGPLGRFGLGAFAASQRRFDRAAAQRVHTLVANSTEVAARIRRWWQRDAVVVAPPVDTEYFRADPAVAREDFFLLAGRLVPYKHPEIAVAAAVRAGVRLVVAGDGRAFGACKRVAGSTIEFVGAVDKATLRDYYRRCRALLYPGREDFGIMPVEAQSCGAPVIALDAGGARDTVVDGTTGVLYSPDGDQTQTLSTALRTFDVERYDHTHIAQHAQHFTAARFRREFQHIVNEVVSRG